MTTLDKQIKITAVTSAYPETSAIGRIADGGNVDYNVIKNITDGAFLQGKFFKTFSAVNFNSLTATQEANGDETWQFATKIEGINHDVKMRKSDILGSVALQAVENESEIDAIASKYNIQKDETYITVDGKKYFVSMNIPLHFGTGDTPNVIMNLAIFVFGTEGLAAAVAAVVAQLGLGAFTTVLANINNALLQTLWAAVSGVMQLGYTFLQTFVASLIQGEALGVAFAAGQAAVGEAIAEGVFSAITTAALAYTVVGILVIALIFLIMSYVLHYTYQNVYIYNLTKYDLDFDFNYIYEGNPHNVQSRHLPARMQKTGPGGSILGNWYSGTAFRFQSDSQVYGLGYAMGLTLKTPGTQAVYKTMACMFDIPYTGNNSLLASATQPPDFKRFYLDNEGKVKRLQHVADDGELEIIITYDYLSGTHPDPETGDLDYLYNSVVIIRERRVS